MHSRFKYLKGLAYGWKGTYCEHLLLSVLFRCFLSTREKWYAKILNDLINSLSFSEFKDIFQPWKFFAINIYEQIFKSVRFSYSFSNPFQDSLNCNKSLFDHISIQFILYCISTFKVKFLYHIRSKYVFVHNDIFELLMSPISCLLHFIRSVILFVSNYFILFLFRLVKLKYFVLKVCKEVFPIPDRFLL